MGKAALVRTNLAELGIAKIATDSAASANLPAINLLTPEPSELWRSSSAAPWKCGGLFNWQTASWPVVDSLALVGHNLRAGSGQFRFASFSTTTGLTFQHLPPTSISGTTNVTGSYTDVDEDPTGTPDANWISPTAAGSTWIALFGFGAPTYDLAAGAGKQAFVAWVKRSGTPTEDFLSPFLTAQLYKSGVLVADLGGKYVTSDTGQWLIWTWDALADFADVTGADVEVRLVATNGASTFDVHLGVLDWYAETVGDGSSTLLDDSGWLNAVTELGVSEFGSMRPIEVEPSATALYLLSAEISARRIYFYLRDDGAPAGLSLAERQIELPDGYVQAGVLVAGTAWRPTYNFSFGDVMGPHVDLSAKTFADGGQTWGQKLARLRTLQLPLATLTQSEAAALLDLIWRKGRLSPMLVSLIPDSATEAKHSTLWATIEEASAVAARAAFLAGQSVRGMSIKFVEYL